MQENYPSLAYLAEVTLVFRSHDYVSTLLTKLADQGIQHARQLTITSIKAMETMLADNGIFNFGEMADVVIIRKTIEKFNRGGGDHRRGRSGGGGEQSAYSRGRLDGTWPAGMRSRSRSDRRKGSKRNDGKQREQIKLEPVENNEFQAVQRKVSCIS